jgi:hypothetical protein
MTDDEKIAALGQALPAVDVDDRISQQIARRARVDLVRGPSRARLVLPIVAGVLTASYLAWTIAKLIELLG